MAARVRATMAVTLAISIFPAVAVSATDDEGAELKAVFITRIARFVEWPEGSFESPSSPIRVGVLGASQIYNALHDSLRGASANGRPFELRYLDSLDKASDVHIVVLTDKGRADQRKAARTLRETPVLAIGPSFFFAESGGIMGLEIYDGKVAFEVNNQAAKDADLRISSRVLKLATTVY
jgi:hypothetical protein